MDGVCGISLQRIVEVVLAIVAMVFFLIEKMRALDPVVLLSIMVVSYLVILVVLALARRDNMVGSAGQVGMETTFGVLLLFYNIAALDKSSEGLELAAYIMNVIVGVLFLLFALF